MKRVVLVTGGNRGIGRACADAFVAAGDMVAITNRQATLTGMLNVACDVTSGADVDSAFCAVEESLGSVDILVCSAAIAIASPALRTSDESFSEVINTNLHGAFRACRRAIGPMIRKRWGRIVLLSSVAAYNGPTWAASYAASKAGLLGLMRSLAREVAPYNVTVNAVAPGIVNTGMALEAAVLEEGRIGAIPQGRVGEPAEIAAAVVFLASQQASYITGVVLPADGGLIMGT